MIIGIGVDIVEVDRLQQSVSRYGDRFLDKIFTSGEIATCRKRHNFEQNLAMLFAAKEAVVKAMGTGIRDGIQWKDIEIRFKATNKATLHLTGKCREAVHDLGASVYWISLSSTASYAVAMVVFESI